MMDKIRLYEILNSKDSLRKLPDMPKEELKEMLGKEFSDMKDFNQNNPHHCYDLLTHSIEVVCGLFDTDLPKEKVYLLKVAALFHDIGKPVVAFEKQGRTVFYGHAAKSVEIARPILEALAFNKEETDTILFYIRHHDDFISFKFENTSDNKSIQIISKESVKKLIDNTIEKARKKGDYIPTYEDYKHLMHLCYADASAQSEIVIKNGVQIDSKAEKLKRTQGVSSIINELL